MNATCETNVIPNSEIVNGTNNCTASNDLIFDILYNYSSLYLATVGFLGIVLNITALTKLVEVTKVSRVLLLCFITPNILRV